MCARAVVIGEIRTQDAAEMHLVQHDHVIETLATQRADHALDIGVLPGTPWTGYDLGDTKAGDPASHPLVIDIVAQRYAFSPCDIRERSGSCPDLRKFRIIAVRGDGPVLLIGLP